jgi:hypothetical protein
MKFTLSGFTSLMTVALVVAITTCVLLDGIDNSITPRTTPVVAAGASTRTGALRQMEVTVRDASGRIAPCEVMIYGTKALLARHILHDFGHPITDGLERLAFVDHCPVVCTDMPLGNKAIFVHSEELGWVRCENVPVTDTVDTTYIDAAFRPPGPGLRVQSVLESEVEVLPVYCGVWPDLTWRPLEPGGRIDLARRIPDGPPVAMLVRHRRESDPWIYVAADGEVVLGRDNPLSANALQGLLGPNWAMSAGAITDPQRALRTFDWLRPTRRGREVSTHGPFAMVHVFNGERDVLAFARATGDC